MGKVTKEVIMKVKDDDMQTAIDTVTKPAIRVQAKEPKRLIQAEVNEELYLSAEKEMKRLGITIKTAMEYGLRAFLLKTNPVEFKKFVSKEISRLGLKIEE